MAVAQSRAQQAEKSKGVRPPAGAIRGWTRARGVLAAPGATTTIGAVLGGRGGGPGPLVGAIAGALLRRDTWTEVAPAWWQRDPGQGPGPTSRGPAVDPAAPPACPFSDG